MYSDTQEFLGFPGNEENRWSFRGKGINLGQTPVSWDVDMLWGLSLTGAFTDHTVQTHIKYAKCWQIPQLTKTNMTGFLDLFILKFRLPTSLTILAVVHSERILNQFVICTGNYIWIQMVLDKWKIAFWGRCFGLAPFHEYNIQCTVVK